MNSKPMILFIILLVGCFPQVSSDIYAPAMPMMAKSLHVHINMIQMSMAIFMVGFAVSQLFYGPLSEGVGRRPAMILGLSIALVGSLINVFAMNISLLYVGRLIQGLGAGTCALFRTLLKDSFDGDEMAKYTSYLVIFITFIIPSAPAVGAYLSHYLGWRSTFVFLLIYALVAINVVAFIYKETSRYHHRDRLKFSFIRCAFKELFTSRIFVGYSVAVLITYGAYFSWLIVTPVLLIHQLGISPVMFGWITLVGTSSVMVLSGVLNARLVIKYGGKTMVRTGWAIMTLSGILLMVGKFLFGLTLIGVVVPMMISYLGSFFIWPNTAVGAFGPFGKIAGYAGSAYGFLQIAGGAIIGTLVSHLPDENQLPLAIIVLTCSTLAWLIYELIARPAVDREAALTSE